MNNQQARIEALLNLAADELGEPEGFLRIDTFYALAAEGVENPLQEALNTLSIRKDHHAA